MPTQFYKEGIRPRDNASDVPLTLSSRPLNFRGRTTKVFRTNPERIGITVERNSSGKMFSWKVY